MCLIHRLFASGTGAVFTIAAAFVLLGAFNDPASLRSHVKTFFPLEKKTFCGHDAEIDTASEGLAGKGTGMMQVACVHKNISPVIIFFMNKIEQSPCGNSVKIPAGTHMKISPAVSELNLKIRVHDFFSFENGWQYFIPYESSAGLRIMRNASAC